MKKKKKKKENAETETQQTQTKHTLNYNEIKGREAHVAWVISARWIFNNILILLLASSAFSISWVTVLRKGLKCHALIGLETKSGKIKM